MTLIKAIGLILSVIILIYYIVKTIREHNQQARENKQIQQLQQRLLNIGKVCDKKMARLLWKMLFGQNLGIQEVAKERIGSISSESYLRHSFILPWLAKVLTKAA